MDAIVDSLQHFANAFDAASGIVERIVFRALGLFGFIFLAYRFASSMRGARRR